MIDEKSISEHDVNADIDADNETDNSPVVPLDHMIGDAPKEEWGSQDEVPKTPCGECGPGYSIGDEGCRHA